MILNSDELKYIRSISEKAAQKAGKVILEYKKKGFKTLTKDSGSSAASQALTEVDLQVQNIIIDLLTPLIDKYDLGLLTEEGENDSSRLEKDYFFSVDPMDGTKPFIDKSEGFSVSIALVSKSGIPVVGVVYDPVNKNLYSSVEGCGVFKNSERWNPELKEPEKPFKLLVDPSLKRLESEDVEYFEYGGAVLNSIKVLEGEVDCYFKPPKEADGGGSIWDFSAVTLFFNELNSVAEDFYGNKIFLNDHETTFMNRYGVFFAGSVKLKSRGYLFGLKG